MKKIIFLVLACSANFFSIAQTSVSGGIFANTTWQKSKSPYIVTGKIIVFDDVTLTIEPGVVVKVNAGIQIEFKNSKLLAVGTEKDSIIFTTNVTPAIKGSWEGITASSNTTQTYQGPQVTLEYVKGMFANIFFRSSAYYSNNVISNSTFSFNQTAVTSASNTIVEKCLFYKNDIGAEGGDRSFKFINSVFDRNINGGKNIKYVENCSFRNHIEYALYPYGITKGCLFENNKVAVYSPFYNSENDTFIDNIVINNETGVQMGTYFNGAITFTGNKICNNQLYNVERIDNGNSANLANNCWCSTDIDYIESKIKDAKDDINLALVTISSFDSSPDCIPNITALDPISISERKIIISPNPASEYFLIKGLKNQDEVLLLDKNGIVLLSLININNNEHIISISDLLPGIYAVVINGKLVNKIVKI